MTLFRPISVAVAALMLAACDRAKTPPIKESAVARPLSPADSAIAATTKNWDFDAGPVLLVAGGSPSQAFVIAPDSANAESRIASLPRPAAVTLFGRNGTVQSADMPSVSEPSGCAATTLSAAPPPKPWSVGFVGGVVAPVALDSVEALSRADSAQLVVEAARLASALPNDSAGRFTGLPFVVRSVWRFTIPSGNTVVIATLSRQINQEATPLQERTLLVAERAPNDTTWTTAYSERSYGDEETIENQDVLAVALVGAAHVPALIVARDYGTATEYGLVERGDDGIWRARWRSGRRHC